MVRGKKQNKSVSTQPKGSGRVPHWMPVRVSYRRWARGPILPPLTTTCRSSQPISPMGEMTAAVPVPQASFSVPSAPASKSSWAVISRSSTFSPQDFSSSRQDLRVMPGRTEPVSSGVSTVSPTWNMTFMEPTSSIYFR